MTFASHFFPQWHCFMLSCNQATKPRGPEAGLSESEMMTILIMHHSCGFHHFKNFYNHIILERCKRDFPKAPSYERFIASLPKIAVPMMFYMHSKLGKKTNIYYIDSTSLPVCHNKRIYRHKTFDGLASRGKTSMGWFFGFKLHLVFNNVGEIVAVKLTNGGVHDAAPVVDLTKDLTGKLFGDKGYLGKKLAEVLLERGLQLITRVRKNMKSLPISMMDKLLLNGRNIAETIIGHLKEFSSLNLPKHRSVMNALTNIFAAIAAYQLNPIKPKKLRSLTTQ
jgi:hypothetical protein